MYPPIVKIKVCDVLIKWPESGTINVSMLCNIVYIQAGAEAEVSTPLNLEILRFEIGDFEIWDFEILRFWDFEIWDFEILRFWDFKILRFWDFKI